MDITLYPSRTNYIKHRHYIRRTDGLSAWLVRHADRWYVYVANRLVAKRTTWDDAVQAAQRQIGRVLR